MALLSGSFLVLGLALAVAVGAGMLAWGLFRLVGRWTARTDGKVDDNVAKAMAPPLSFLLAIVAGGAVVLVLAARLDADVYQGTRRFLAAMLAVGGAWAVVRIIRLVLEETGRRKQRFLPATRVGGRLVAVVLYVMAFLTIMSQYGISITPLLTGLGIAGLAAALALQDTLGNFFAGITVQTGQSMQPGHFIRLEEEKLDGYVEYIGWRTTRIRQLSGNTIIIPNSKLANSIVTDTYLPTPEQSCSVEFLVGQEIEPARVLAILTEEAKKVQDSNDGVVKDSPPGAMFWGPQEYANRFTIAVRITEYVQQFQVMHAMRLGILARFRQEGIRIPYPTRHNLEEKVEPEAKRDPRAPGGFRAAGKRPSRRKGEEPPPKDPMLVEAEKAKAEIAAQQAEKHAKEGTDPDGDHAAAAAAAARQADAGAKPAPKAGLTEGGKAEAEGKTDARPAAEAPKPEEAKPEGGRAARRDEKGAVAALEPENKPT